MIGHWRAFRLHALLIAITAAFLLAPASASHAARFEADGLRAIDQNFIAAMVHSPSAGDGFLLASEGGDGGDGGDADDRISPFSADPRLAALAAQILRQGSADCGGLRPEYRISCLAAVYDEAASVLRGPEYAPARRELQFAARRLEGIARANADPAAPPVAKGRRRITAVKKSAVSKTNQQARQVIAETETRLIRSAGSSSRRARYAQIAQAVGSTKNILRS